jgi:hypothetical protein
MSGHPFLFLYLGLLRRRLVAQGAISEVSKPEERPAETGNPPFPTAGGIAVEPHEAMQVAAAGIAAVHNHKVIRIDYADDAVGQRREFEDTEGVLFLLAIPSHTSFILTAGYSRARNSAK